ncbi:MAG: sigma-70 family RNA polymerase sigma factor [Candidatus Paceibacterota bacterium]
MTIQQEIQLKMLLTEAHGSYANDLKRRAYYKVSDGTLAEDLVQNTFLKTWNYLVKGGKIETMKAFLYHILNNLIVDEYRKHKTVSLDTLLTKGFEPSIDDSKRTISKLDGREAILLIDCLPPKYQKVMRMRYLDELTLDEMSEITGQLKNTIAVQIHRGTELLKGLYKK